MINGRATILLLHLALMRFKVPTELLRLLADKEIYKAGRQIGGDISKLRNNDRVPIEANSVLELGSSLRLRGLIDSGCVLSSLSLQACASMCIACMYSVCACIDASRRFSAVGTSTRKSTQETQQSHVC